MAENHFRNLDRRVRCLSAFSFCFRLFILGSYDRETYVHCTVELSSHEWREKPRSSIKRVCFLLPVSYTPAHTLTTTSGSKVTGKSSLDDFRCVWVFIVCQGLNQIQLFDISALEKDELFCSMRYIKGLELRTCI